MERPVVLKRRAMDRSESPRTTTYVRNDAEGLAGLPAEPDAKPESEGPTEPPDPVAEPLGEGNGDPDGPADARLGEGLLVCVGPVPHADTTRMRTVRRERARASER